MWGFCFDLDETIWSQGDPQWISFPYHALSEKTISLMGGACSVKPIFCARYKNIFQLILQSPDIKLGFITSGLWERSDVKDFFLEAYDIDLGDHFFLESRCRIKVEEFDPIQYCMVWNQYPNKGPKLKEVRDNLQHQFGCKKLLFFDDSLMNILTAQQVGWKAIFMPHNKEQVSCWLQYKMMKKLNMTKARCGIQLFERVNNQTDTVCYFLSESGVETKIATMTSDQLDSHGMATLSFDQIDKAIDTFISARNGACISQDHGQTRDAMSSDTMEFKITEDAQFFIGTRHGMKLNIAINHEQFCYQGMKKIESMITACQQHHRPRHYISKLFHSGELPSLDRWSRDKSNSSNKACCEPRLMCGQPRAIECT